jgi:hypothetical protein
MLDALDLRTGGYLWFLRSGPERRRQAWTAKELDEMLGLEGDEGQKE